MMERGAFSRRAMMAGAAMLATLPAFFLARPKADAVHAAILSALSDRRAAAMVGRMALAAWPQMRNADDLARRILGDTGTAGDTGALRERLSAVIRDDFAQGRTLKLDGWLLAETEVRLCALAALNA